MVEHVPEETNEPTPIGEILDNQLDEVVGFDGDPARATAAKKTDLGAEREDLQAQIDLLWEEIEAGRADEDAPARLEALKRAMLAVDADRVDLDRSQGGKPPQ